MFTTGQVNGDLDVDNIKIPLLSWTYFFLVGLKLIVAHYPLRGHGGAAG